MEISWQQRYTRAGSLLDSEYPSKRNVHQIATNDWAYTVAYRIENKHNGDLPVVVVE